jgi:hypothetical protein
VDPLDPQRILRELPERERANFLAAYREALDGAQDPAGWGQLRRVLRLWSGMVIATNRAGFYEAQEAALTGTSGGDASGGLHPTAPYPGVKYRPYLESSTLRQMHGVALAYAYAPISVQIRYRQSRRRWWAKRWTTS